MQIEQKRDESEPAVKGQTLFSCIKGFFSPTVFPDDEDKTRLARVLNTLLLSVAVFLVLYGCIAIPFIFVEKLFNTSIGLGLFGILAAAYPLMRSGRVHLAGGLLVAGMWLLFTLFLPFAGGTTSVVVVFYLVGTVMTGLLLRTRGALIYAGTCSLAGLVMVFLEASGYQFLRIFPVSPLVGWVDMTIALLLTVLVLRLVLDGLQEALLLTRERLNERRQAEAALRESEQKFRILFETSRDFSYITDIDGKIIEVNKAASIASGYSVDELKKKKIQEFYFDPTQRDLLIKKVIEQGFVENLEIKGKLKDGVVIDVLVNSTAIKNNAGNVVGFQGSIKDISERKRAENALLESEEKFRTMIEQAAEGYALVDENGSIIAWNRAIERIWGLPREEVLGKQFYDVQYSVLVPERRTPERYEYLKSAVMDSIRTGQSTLFDRSIEAELCRPDGERVFIQQSIFPIKTERGYRIGSMSLNITKRKKTEDNLSQQVERLRALHTIDQAMTSSLDLKTVLDVLVREIVDQLQVDATAVLLLNSNKQTLDFAAGQGFHTGALRYTSLKIGTGLAGRAAKERKIVHVANLAELDNNPILAHSIINEKFITYFGVPLIAKDQLRGVLEIFHRSALAPDPNWLQFLETLAGQAAISIDNAYLLEVTQASLKETNALYRINQDMASTINSEQLMEKVVNLLQESFGYYYVQIFVMDPETGNFVMRSGSGNIGSELKSQGYQLSPGEGIVGYTAETGKPFFTNDVDHMISFVRAPFLPDTKSELAVPIKTGNQFLGLLDIQQVPPASLSERDVQLVSAVADQLAVTLQKTQLYSDLQNSLLQEQTTRSKLIQTEKLAVAGRLLASVSHELNNPLQAIQNALFLLKDEEGLSTQGQQDLKIVLSEAERMATLLERLRTTYQPAPAEDFQLVQINNIIEDVRALVSTHLRHSHIIFEFNPDKNLPSFPGLGNQLKQVILNLFMNAVDAMADGGRLITSTNWLKAQKEILITVTDSGTGIDKSVFPNIFEAFVTMKEKGTGLGLAISYEIVLKHRGRIQAENNPKGGATFSIWLPVEVGGIQ